MQTDTFTSSSLTSLRARLDNSWNVFRAPVVGSIATTSASMMKDSVCGEVWKSASTNETTTGY